MFRRAWAMAAALLTFGLAGAAFGDVQLHGLFTDHMVLQQKMDVPVWGTADPWETVTVEFRGKKATATAWKDGSWNLKIKSGRAGGPFEMKVIGKNTIVLRDVLVGEVWVASGQSNMQWSVVASLNAEQEIAAADYPEIRLFSVPMRPTVTPDGQVGGTWVRCAPGSVGNFSAVAYYFGRTLHKDMKVPVGLINSSWGGTRAEAWTSREHLVRLGTYGADIQLLDQTLGDQENLLQKEQEIVAEWEHRTGRADPGNKGFGQGWAAPEFDDSGWPTMDLPVAWEMVEGMGTLDGAVWFRRTVEVPQVWAGKDLTLRLGPVDDYDVTYFNGEKIGSTGSETPGYWASPRRYTVPGRLVKAGSNTIAVRAYDHFGGGGINGAAGLMSLSDEGGEPIELEGPWKYQVEHVIVATANDAKPGTGGANNPNTATVLFNGMIWPLVPYGIRGAIWYQGESNSGAYDAYRLLLPAMIESWRDAWQQGDFAFGIVQLANFMARHDQPTDTVWARLRETQTQTLSVPNTGLAVTIDIGDAVDIHPKNKQDVGKRLALWAEAKVYGKKVVYSGPMFESMEVKDGKAILSFDHVGGGLVVKGDQLKGFAVAGEDRNFVWANARIDGKKVIVWSDQVAEPVAVRYAWADNPEANLYNEADLPAVPFRTDGW